MNRTDTSDPNYYHRVVDCQWACPSHTNVPEYIRMIAQGRFDDAYILNRESNVFPGILGRTCDRPCEPACRRGRVDGKPVAICRLKRVAADHKDTITDRLPAIPTQKNGKRVALVGAGPSSSSSRRRTPGTVGHSRWRFARGSSTCRPGARGRSGGGHECVLPPMALRRSRKRISAAR